MTSSNINKIMRSNLQLKPWILSKNTTEIVNTCIQKIYKQSQNNFKNGKSDLTKVASSKPENKAPIRALKSQERERVPLSINVSRAKKSAATTVTTTGNAGSGTAGGVTATPATTAVNVATGERLASNAAANNRRSALASLAANRKLLKSSPNYKIYSSRRFGSSASSSNASIFRRNDERRRSTTQTAQLNYLLRTFATQMNNRQQPLTSILPKFMMSARNQHMETRTTNALPTHLAQMATAIQRDLMPINSALRDRIALGRPRLSKMAATAAQKAKNLDPMNGWHHPPAQQMFLKRVNHEGIANAEIQEQYKRMKNENRMRQFEHIAQSETRQSILGSVSKKTVQPRVVDAFEMDGAAPRDSPRPAARNQTPNFEHAYKLLSRKQIAETDTLKSPTLPPVNISHITQAAAPATQKSKSGTERSVTTTTYGKTTTEQQMKKQPSEERALTHQFVPQPQSATPIAPTNSSNLPALHPPQTAVGETLDRTMTMSKKSATSQVVSKVVADAAARSQMRFSHSAHLKKFS